MNKRTFGVSEMIALLAGAFALVVGWIIITGESSFWLLLLGVLVAVAGVAVIASAFLVDEEAKGDPELKVVSGKDTT